eukprot:4517955-Heterocapsa_arctica.AAC.1
MSTSRSHRGLDPEQLQRAARDRGQDTGGRLRREERRLPDDLRLHEALRAGHSLRALPAEGGVVGMVTQSPKPPIPSDTANAADDTA